MPSLFVSKLNHANFKIIRLVYHNLNFRKIEFIVIFGINTCIYVERALCAASYAKSFATRWGGGGTLIFSTYVGLCPASTVHPQIILGISSTKNIFEI